MSKIIQKTSPIKTSLIKIDALIDRLDAVKHLAESGYWITTEELCVLLELDTSALQSLNFKEPLYTFAWRNFIFTQIASQDTVRMWSIADQQQRTNRVSIESESKKLQIEVVNDRQTSQAQLQSQSDLQSQAHRNGQAQITIPTATTTISHPIVNTPPTESEIFPSAYALIENFFTAQQLQKLLQYVEEQQSNFTPTSNSANDPNYRRSMVLHSFPEFTQLMMERVRAIMPYILTYLGIESFIPSNVEAQLTLHNDGNYYKIHNDSGSPDTANRVLTYVYYFYREPKPFSGGELLIYDSKVENNFYVAASTYKTIQPKNNSIVFFLSRYMHEVLPVSCPTKAFLDSRFTINGWVRK